MDTSCWSALKAPTTTPTPATVEVVRHAFMSGAEQMRRNLYRSAYSPVIYEMKDCSVGIYDANGDLLGQAPGLPFFLGSLAGTIKAVLEIHGRDAFAEGDVWLVNDSAICGSHLNDYRLRADRARRRAARLQRREGALERRRAKDAGYVSDSTEIFQEACGSRRCGSSTPRGRPAAARPDRAQLALPGPLVGDFWASVTACRTGGERYRSIVGRYGWEQVDASIARFFAQAARADRESVSRSRRHVPARGELDNDGINTDPVPVQVAVTIAGDT